jgi:hypothetical protein
MSKTKSRHVLKWVGATSTALSLAGCFTNAVKPDQGRALDMTFYDFSSDMRWSDFDAAYDFVDPKTKMDHPLTDVDTARLKQIEISEYHVTSSLKGDGVVDQQVQLLVVNRNTQIQRTIIYHEHWRWDSSVKRWWLTTGLPDFSPQDQ